jgi:hypothetical protein
MAAEASHLDATLVVAIFAVAHGPAVVGSAPETGDGVTPDVAAIAADAVLFVNPFFVGSAQRAMAIGASEPGPLHVDGVRKPDVGGLARVDEPRRGGLGLQVHVDKLCLRGRSTEFVGVASSAGVVLWEAGERAVGAEGMARFTIRIAGFFAVRLVQEIDWLRLMRIKDPGKNDPTSNQGKSETKGEDEQIPFHM